MESLGNILHNYRTSGVEPKIIERVKTYVRKKHGFLPDISLSPQRITLYAPTASQASLLRLDWANIKQLADTDDISIRVRKKT